MATLGVEILKGETDGETLPLIIQPKNSESRSVEYLKDWITDNQETINEYLLTYGMKGGGHPIRFIVSLGGWI